jgi:hypothetical protein
MTHRSEHRSGIVSASEIASFVYCAEQWRLQHGLANESEDVAAIDRGEAFHAETARLEVGTRKASRLGLLLVVLAAVLLLLGFLVGR